MELWDGREIKKPIVEEVKEEIKVEAEEEEEKPKGNLLEKWAKKAKEEEEEYVEERIHGEI